MCGQRFRRFHGRWRACPSNRLLLGCGLLANGCGWSGMSVVGPGSLSGMRYVPRLRRRPPKPPGTRDRWPCGISNECTCHRADRPQNHRSRHRPQGGASGTLLGLSLERNKRRCDQCGNQQFFHRDFPEPSAEHRNPKLRRRHGDNVTGGSCGDSALDADTAKCRNRQKARSHFAARARDFAMMNLCG